MSHLTQIGIAAAALLVASIAAPAASASTGSGRETLVLGEGGTVTLAADHLGSIVIWADDVTLDCAGHRVMGPSSDALSGGIEIAGGSRVTVRNCVVVGFEVDGIFGYGSTIHIEGNKIAGNGGHGVHLDSVSDTTIAGNTIRGNGVTAPSIGIVLTNSDSVTVTANIVASQEWAGIGLLDGTTASTVSSNSVTGSGIGILVQDSSDANQVRENTVWANSHGISVLASSGNSIEGNTANTNGYTGISADWDSSANAFSHNTANMNNDGLALHSTSGNSVTDNTANNNRHAGFIVWSGSSDNYLANNTGLNNVWFDGYDEDGSLGNTWDGNTFRTTNF